MSKSYRVASGCCVVGQDNKIYRANSKLPGNYADPETIEGHIRSGHVVPVGSSRLEQADAEAAADHRQPGVTSPLPITHKERKPTDSPVEVRTPPEKPAKAAISPWTLDPKGLDGKSLEELNITIMELDETGNPPEFESVEEAIAFLSQDFE